MSAAVASALMSPEPPAPRGGTKTTIATGLSEQEAAARLRRDGPNELPAARPRSLVAMALEVVREPMFLLLIATGTIYLLLGDPVDAVALLAAVFLVIGITLYQEHKTERALEALRDLSSPRALVIRDGVARRIAGREVVRGDVVILREGDRVPADGTLDSAGHLLVDESLLSGESVPVRKRVAQSSVAAGVGGEDRPFVYSGTLVVRGEAAARVIETGAATELGKIGAALSHVEIGRTALQREVTRIVRVLAVVGLGACVLVGIVYGVARHEWLAGALAGLTLAISMVPEEFPVVLTVFLALGAWRISRSRVLTRRIPAIETLGSATVLCVDKTGTLTLNRMTVATLVAGDERHVMSASPGTLAPAFTDLLSVAVRASKPGAFDPMERAIVDSARDAGIDMPERALLVREYPLSNALLAMTHVWKRSNEDSGYDVAAKGAPEAVVSLCNLSDDQRGRVLAHVDRMAHEGLRVIAVGRAAWRDACLPTSAGDFRFEFAGLIGLADPVRPGVPDAIRECRTARIRVVMITGDYPATALNIGRQIGLANIDECLTGSEIAQMTDDDLKRRIRRIDVFARIIPEQKLRLVTALQQDGEVVAMTGDGVNDAPALKAADIGVAMGARGSDVAREAAGLVLLDDDFSSIVRAVRLGRRIYNNIEKATAYVLAIHVPIAGITLLPVLAGWPLVLLPVHVIMMELIVDPACSIAFEMEPEDSDIMRRAPRDPRQRLFTRRLVARSLLQGFGAWAAAAAVLALAVTSGMSERDIRSVTFATLIVTNIALIATNRSLARPFWAHGASNPALRWLVGGALLMLAAILYLPFLRGLFRVEMPHPDDLLIVSTAGIAALAWMEAVKRLMRGGEPSAVALRG